MANLKNDFDLDLTVLKDNRKTADIQGPSKSFCASVFACNYKTVSCACPLSIK